MIHASHRASSRLVVDAGNIRAGVAQGGLAENFFKDASVTAGDGYSYLYTTRGTSGQYYDVFRGDDGKLYLSFA